MRTFGGITYLAIVAAGYLIDYYVFGWMGGFAMPFAYMIMAVAFGIQLGHKGERAVIRARDERNLRWLEGVEITSITPIERD